MSQSILTSESSELARYQAVHRRGLNFLLSPDLEWLQERIVTEFSAIAGAQSAALWVLDERGQLGLRAYRGLLDKRSLPEKLDATGPLAARLLEGLPWPMSGELADGFRLPLKAAGEVLGLLQLSDALTGSFTPEDLQTAKMLGEFAAVAIKNGRRMLSLQRLGLRDKESMAYNQSYFTDYASKEIYKARRYGRIFSLLTLGLDNVGEIRARSGAETAKRATGAIIRGLSQMVRDADVIAKASERDLYVLLPETDFFGATIFCRRALGAIAEQPELREMAVSSPLGFACGVATFPRDGDDFDELIHRCRARMDGQRASLFRRLKLEHLPFWDAAEILLGGPTSPKLPFLEKAEPSRRGRVAEAFFGQLQDEIGRELLRDPSARGVLYVGGPEVRATMPIAAALHGAPVDFAPRVYLLGARRDLEAHPSLTPVFLEGDERLARSDFILWLSESAAYAMLQRKGQGACWGFHTSDAGVVEGLVAKLQEEYDLQPY